MTVPSVSVGQQIARALVSRRLAACVNVVPGVQSVYWWQGAVHEDDEALLLVKTETRLLGALGLALRELHPYDVPELLAVKVDKGSEKYLKWLSASVGIGKLDLAQGLKEENLKELEGQQQEKDKEKEEIVVKKKEQDD